MVPTTGAVLELRLFGAFEMAANGTQICPLPPRKAQWLMAVFAGGWKLRAAGAVAADPDEFSADSADDRIEEGDVMDLLASLAEKSLVVVESAERETRYRLLETVREYALEHLVRGGEEDAVRLRHREHFYSLAEWLETMGSRAMVDGIKVLSIVEEDLANLRSALDWCLECDERIERGARTAGFLYWLWWETHRVTEGRRYLSRFVARRPDGAVSKAWSYAFRRMGHLESVQGDLTTSRASLEKALELDRLLGDREFEARSLYLLGHLALQRCDPETAKSCYETAKPIFEELGDLDYATHCISSWGNHLLSEGDVEGALDGYGRATANYPDGATHLGTDIQVNTCDAWIRQGRLLEARQELQRFGESWAPVSVSVHHLQSEIAVLEGDTARARSHVHRALSLADRDGLYLATIRGL